jgi:hypothetical protein
LILSKDLSDNATVTPFLFILGTITDVPIASVAVAYDCQRTSTTYILIFHQVLYLKHLDNALLNPNQLRHHGLEVNECPISLLPTAQRQFSSHFILSPDIQIPLSSMES